jgi:hypothetical protein
MGYMKQYRRPYDKQRQRVYDWERSAIPDFYGYNSASLTLQECRELVELVCEDYGSKHPMVVLGRGKTAWGGMVKLTLPTWAHVPAVVLHELTHNLVSNHTTGIGVVGHGPEFVRLFIELLVAYMGLSKTELRAAARNHKVKVATEAACQPSGARRGHTFRKMAKIGVKEPTKESLIAELRKMGYS